MHVSVTAACLYKLFIQPSAIFPSFPPFIISISLMHDSLFIFHSNIYSSIHHSFYPSVYPGVSLFFQSCICLSFPPSFHPFTCLSSIYLFFHHTIQPFSLPFIFLFHWSIRDYSFTFSSILSTCLFLHCSFFILILLIFYLLSIYLSFLFCFSFFFFISSLPPLFWFDWLTLPWSSFRSISLAWTSPAVIWWSPLVPMAPVGTLASPHQAEECGWVCSPWHSN